MLTVFGVFLVAEQLYRSREAAWLSALCVAISPWAVLHSRIAWDPALAPAFFVWSAYFLLRGPGSSDLMRGMLGGVLGALACYAYPPMRIQVTLVFPLFAFALWRAQPHLRRHVGAFVLTGTLACLPLLRFTIGGETQQRANHLSILNEAYLAQFSGFSIAEVARIFAGNLLSYFTPDYLLLRGDANLRHSTQAVGQWSWLDILAALIGLALLLRGEFRQEGRRGRILLMLITAYLFALAPAALTWDGNPHALRSIGAYPLLAICAGGLLWTAMQKWRLTVSFVVLVAASFSAFFFFDLFAQYPERAQEAFNATVSAQTGQTEVKYDRLMGGFGVSADTRPSLPAMYFRLRAGVDRCPMPPA